MRADSVFLATKEPRSNQELVQLRTCSSASSACVRAVALPCGLHFAPVAQRVTGESLSRGGLP